MKKSKILVPALAVLALGVAGSAVGTVAWFVNDSKATLSVAAAAAESVTAKSEMIDLGNFKFVPVVTSISSQVGLSDDEGKCYVYVGGTEEANKVEVPLADPIGTIAWNLSVTYEGDLTDLNEVKAAYADKIASLDDSYVVTVTATGNAGGNIKFLSASAAPDPVGDYWEGAAANGVKTVNKAALAAVVLSGTETFTGNTAAQEEIYFGIDGAERAEDGTEEHEITLTPSLPA